MHRMAYAPVALRKSRRSHPCDTIDSLPHGFLKAPFNVIIYNHKYATA